MHTGPIPFVNTVDAADLEPWSPQTANSANWLGWRMRVLVGVALIGCMALFGLLRALAQSPHLEVRLVPTGSHSIQLHSAGPAELQPLLGQRITRIHTPGLPPLLADHPLAFKSPRWMVNDQDRAVNLAQHNLLTQQLRAGAVTLDFDNGTQATLQAVPRGFGGLGMLFWMLCALALALYLLGAVVYLSRPSATSLLYAVMALAQSSNLLLVAVENTLGTGLPAGFMLINFRLRTGADLATAAAALHLGLLVPRRVPKHRTWAVASWSIAGVVGWMTWAQLLPESWWWMQATLITYGAALCAVMTWANRQEPHAAALVLRRLALTGSGTLGLLSLAVAEASRATADQHFIADSGSVIWYVFFASMLLMAPFLSRSQHVMREFAMLAGLSTVATSLDLLFITVFALGQFTSLTLALFISIGCYAGARQWLMTQLASANLVTAERTFESLYRAARAIESTPQQTVEHLARLMNELFEPLEIRRDPRTAQEAMISADATTLALPLPALSRRDNDLQGSLILRHARRGRRLFSSDDARLANRVLEQLRTAVAYDRAVEQGRSEERLRLAQDLHDDIGARLLTLMYKAPNPEMEEYVRHTLQDLKTLTRGLAASEHLLSHASAEWKADITQRLAVSQCELVWNFQARSDVALSVVQWSGLTRILRELVNNVIAHAGATEVQINATFDGTELQMSVADDGQGGDPKTWSHGLGLGGVRKRVKLLGGTVHWHQRTPQGVVCEVRIPKLGEVGK